MGIVFRSLLGNLAHLDGRSGSGLSSAFQSGGGRSPPVRVRSTFAALGDGMGPCPCCSGRKGTLTGNGASAFSPSRCDGRDALRQAASYAGEGTGFADKLYAGCRRGRKPPRTPGWRAYCTSTCTFPRFAAGKSRPNTGGTRHSTLDVL